MKLEDQVCSLYLAKQLKALPIKRESLYAWSLETRSNGEQGWFLLRSCISNSEEICPAYTVAELEEMLPHGFEFGKTLEGMCWGCYGEFGCGDNNPADARAKMLIHILKN